MIYEEVWEVISNNVTFDVSRLNKFATECLLDEDHVWGAHLMQNAWQTQWLGIKVTFGSNPWK